MITTNGSWMERNENIMCVRNHRHKGNLTQKNKIYVNSTLYPINKPESIKLLLRSY